jgi:hypothetical protein
MIVQTTLPATKTVPNRTYTFVSAPPGLHFDGTLVVVDKKPRSERQRAYHVCQDQNPSEFGVLAYQLIPNHSADGEVYQVTLRPSGLHSCTCKAGQVKRFQCVHVAAMADIVLSRGALPRGV